MSLELNSLLVQLGRVGKRLSEIGAAEGAAGNLSICFREPLDVSGLFSVTQIVELPVAVPDLAGATLIVTGSGRRLRDILDAPTANLACIIVESGGRTGKMLTAPGCPFTRVTSEFNSHLAVHRDQIVSTGTNFHAVIHAQPLHLTYLSHIPRYQDESYLNRHILRWQPETIVNLPEGLGLLPFRLPGSPELMSGTVQKLRKHRVVVWSKHGVMSRSDNSVKRAGDRIEYAETGARYEYLNVMNHEQGQGLTDEEILAICKAFNVHQDVF